MDDNCNAETLANDENFCSELLTGFTSAVDHDISQTSFLDYQIAVHGNSMAVTVCGKKTAGKGFTMVVDWRNQKHVDSFSGWLQGLVVNGEITVQDEYEIDEDIVNTILKMSGPSVEVA